MTTATNEYPTKAYGATAPDSGVGPMAITRRGDPVRPEGRHTGASREGKSPSGRK